MNTTTEKNTTTETTETTTPEQNTTTATTTDTEKKEGRNTMKQNKKNTTPRNKKNPAPRKNSAPVDTMPGNIEQALKTLSGDVSTLEKLLNTKTLAVKVKSARGTVSKDITAVNTLLAIQYYRNTPLFDIVKAGDMVPAVMVEESEKDGKYTLAVKNITVYPTMTGMKNAGVIDSAVLDRVDVLRRVSAFVKTGKVARVYLNGDTESKKDIPSETVSAMIENMGELSKNKARALMTVVFKDLTGNAYKKDIFPKLYEEFENYVIKRSRKWGERNMVSKATAHDMALEFAWMYFNGKTEFKYNGENV